MDDLNDIQIEEKPSFKPPSAFKHNFRSMVSDMKFVGIFFIVGGALSCLSIIGALWGVPLIIMGLRAREAADRFDYFSRSNDKQSLKEGFELQGKFFKIYKILIIVGIVVTIIYVIGIIMMIFAGLSSYNSYGY